MVAQPVDSSAVDRFVERWVEYCAGGLAVGLVYLGDRLGLFTALRDAGPATPTELAARTGLVERYVREWLAATAASGLVDYTPADRRYALTPKQATCFADPRACRISHQSRRSC
jgi:hypothetical protein